MGNAEMHIRLRRGDSEVEVSGTHLEVDSFLERWWHQAPHGKSDPNTSISKVKKDNLKLVGDSDGESIDTNSLANAVKESPYAPQLKAALHGSSRWDKVRSVLWVAEQELTSGDVFRTLSALDVKMPLSSVSTAIKDNKDKLITSGAKGAGEIVKYRLISKERDAFEDVLRSKTAGQND